MHITYDADADAAYIMLTGTVGKGSAAHQMHSIATPGNGGEVILDFDSALRLIGIEILNAGDVLPLEVREAAQRPV